MVQATGNKNSKKNVRAEYLLQAVRRKAQ